MYWGYENRYFPDETALTIARFLARLDVSVVVGYHPFVVQDHGYLGNTLVLFSLGKVITTNEQTPFCWHKVCILIYSTALIVRSLSFSTPEISHE